MRVLAITPTFFPEVGGLEQVVFDLALRVRELNVTMDVAHVSSDHRRFASESLQALRVFRVPLAGNRVFGYAAALGRLASDYDLLHVHDPQLLALTANVRFACRRTPAVLSTHGGFWHTHQHAWLKKLYERTLLRGSIDHYRRVLASSGSDLEYFKAYSERVELCSNGVDVRRFNAVSTAASRSPNRWIYWGRLARNKRLDRVIASVARARALGHPVDLLVCGRDFDRLLDALTAQVERSGLQDAVRFQPFLDDSALLAELGQRGVYITASEHEGFGLSIVEAMAAGLIVVCRDMKPLNGFLERGRSGVFLRFDGQGDDDRALDSLCTMSADEVAGMAACARMAAAEHDWSHAAQRFVGHYRQVLDVPHGAH